MLISPSDQRSQARLDVPNHSTTSPCKTITHYFRRKTNFSQICSSKLFEDEEEEIREIAQRLLPDIKLIMVPHDLHATGGGNEVVEFLVEQITESRLPTRA
jgi:hypothetical protein